jgi:hypothetical protein
VTAVAEPADRLGATLADAGPAPAVGLLHGLGTDPFGDAVARRVTLEELQRRLGPGVVVRPLRTGSDPAGPRWDDAVPAEHVADRDPVALTGIGCVVVGPGAVDAAARAVLPGPVDASLPLAWYAVGPVVGLHGPASRGDAKDALRRLVYVSVRPDDATVFAELGLDAPTATAPHELAPDLVAGRADRRLAWMRVVGWVPASDPLVVDAALAGAAWTAAITGLARRSGAPVVVVDLRGGDPSADATRLDVGVDHIGDDADRPMRQLPTAATLDDVVALLGACVGLVTASPGAAAVSRAHGRRAVLIDVPDEAGAPTDPATLQARWDAEPDDEAAASAARAARERAAGDLDALAEAVLDELRMSYPGLPSTVARLQDELVRLRDAFDERGRQLLAERQRYADRVGEAVARLDDARRWHEEELRYHHGLVVSAERRAEARAERELARLRRQVTHDREQADLQARDAARLGSELAAARRDLDDALAAIPPAPMPLVVRSSRRARGGLRRLAALVRRFPGGPGAVGLGHRAARRGRRVAGAARHRLRG